MRAYTMMKHFVYHGNNGISGICCTKLSIHVALAKYILLEVDG